MSARTQGQLFDPINEPLVDVPQPVDPHLSEAEKERLSPQNAAVLAMLQRGPVSTDDFDHKGIRRLAARIHDLRMAGYKIVTERPTQTLTIYRLEE